MLTRVAEGVFVHQSELLRNNTVAVEGDSGMLVIDAGVTDAEMACLARDLRELGQTVSVGFSTHPDWDHVLWHADLGDAPRYGTAACAEFMRAFRAQPDWETRAREALPPEIADETPLEGFGLVAALPGGASVVPWDGPRIRIIEHPAHAVGHAALLVEDHGVLIAGDMLSDLFVPMLGEFDANGDPLADYLTGLRTLENVADAATVVIPGHGSVGTGDVRERIARDRSYVEALRDGRDVDDPRIASPEPGWEWVSFIHEGQVESVARTRRPRLRE